MHQSNLRIEIERIYCINGNPYYAAIDIEYMDLEYIFNLYSNLRGNVDNKDTGSPILLQLMELVCKCHELEDENMELAVLKTMISSVTSVSLSDSRGLLSSDRENLLQYIPRKQERCESGYCQRFVDTNVDYCLS